MFLMYISLHKQCCIQILELGTIDWVPTIKNARKYFKNLRFYDQRPFKGICLT